MWSQKVVEGKIVDSIDKEALAFCNIYNKNIGNATISNADGNFTLRCFASDTLILSYLGYQTKYFPAIELQKTSVVELVRINHLLNELVVFDNSDKLYRILEDAQSKFDKNANSRISKVYFAVESQFQNKPIELLEIYYNAYLKKNFVIDELTFKNGRVALNPLENYFLSLHTSKMIQMNPIREKSAIYPINPMQLSKNRNKKTFNLECRLADSTTWVIEYKPKVASNKHFSGEIYIDSATMEIKRIIQEISNAEISPLRPLFTFDTLKNLSIKFETNFRKEEQSMFLDYVLFDMNFDYISVRDSSSGIHVENGKISKRRIHSSGILYLYDYTTPFIEPLFEYDISHNDYRKMTFIPYSPAFWENNQKIILSDKQKASLKIIGHKGETINFKPRAFTNRMRESIDSMGIFTYEFLFWQSNKRIFLRGSNENLLNNVAPVVKQNSIRDFYKFNIQIMLDINPIADTYDCQSYTIFDPTNTFFNLPVKNHHHVLINLAFDLFEIERRELEKKLSEENLDLARIQKLYEIAVSNANSNLSKLLFETQIGENEKALQKWNKMIFELLGIDNIDLFKVWKEDE